MIAPYLSRGRAAALLAVAGATRAQAGTQRPFAIVIVGGIISATLFTLVLLRLLYPLFIRDEK